MMNLPIPPCPHCKRLAGGVLRNIQAAGWISVFYTGNPEETQTSLDKMRYGRSGPLRCAECGKIRHDVTVVERDNDEYLIPVMHGRN